MKLSWRRFAFFKKDALAEGEGALGAALGLPEEAVVTCSCLVETAPRRDVGDILVAEAGEPEAKVEIKALVVVGDDGGRVVTCGGRLEGASYLPPFGGRALLAAGARFSGDASDCCVAAIGEDSRGADGAATHVLRCFAVGARGFEGLFSELLLEDVLGIPTALAVRGDGGAAAAGFATGVVAFYGLDAIRPASAQQAPKKGMTLGALAASTKRSASLVKLGSVAAPSGAPAACVAFTTDARHCFFGTRLANPTGDDVDAGGEVCAVRLPEDERRRGAYANLAPRVLDDRGCGPRCGAFDGSEFVVARRDGLYFYTPEDRGGALGFDGDKTALACVGAGYVAVASSHEKSRRNEVHVYDVARRRVAHMYRLPAGGACVALHGTPPSKPPPPAGDGAASAAPPPFLCSVLVEASNGSLVRFDEKPTPEKLDVLFRMNMFATAIQVGAAARLRPGAIMEIYKMYGDHLYKKCDWTGAVEQYARTVGHVEPSYVIRRFLDAAKIGHLATYLEQAHAPEHYGAAARDGDEAPPTTTRPELTTLLVNCYGKLKNVAALDHFAAYEGDLCFDAATAVVALRDAGYVDHAVGLAARAGEWAWYVLIQLERRDPEPFDALTHLPKLSVLEQFRIVRRFGIGLVTQFPEEATELLMRLATAPEPADRGEDSDDDVVRPEDRINPPACFEAEKALRRKEKKRKNRESKRPAALPGDDDDDDEPPIADDFMHLFIHQPAYLRLFCDYVLRYDDRGRTMNVCNTLLEMLLDEWDAASTAARDAEAKLADLGDDESAAAVLRREIEERRDVANSKTDDLLELLRDDDAPYDKYHALVLVEVKKHPEATLFLYETKFQQPVGERWKPKRLPWWTRRKLRSSATPPPEPPPMTTLPRGVVNQVLLQEYGKRGDVRSMLRVCKGEGKADPLLWTQLLRHAAAEVPEPPPNPKPATWGNPEPPAPPLPEHQDAHDAHVDKCDELGEILRVIHDEKALPPLRVISTVAENEHVPLSAVKPYVMTIVEKNWNDTRRERDAATLLKHENEKMKQQIHDLKCAQVRLLPGRGGPEDRIANSKVGTAEAAMLDVLLYEAKEQEDAALGADGVGDESKTDEQRKWESIKKSMEVVDHEQFFKDLEDEETGGFDCIARYLGKGIMQPALDGTLEQRQKAGLPEMEKIDYDDLPCLPRPKNPEYKVRQNLANPNTRNY